MRSSFAALCTFLLVAACATPGPEVRAESDADAWERLYASAAQVRAAASNALHRGADGVFEVHAGLAVLPDEVADDLRVRLALEDVPGVAAIPYCLAGLVGLVGVGIAVNFFSVRNLFLGG